MKSCRIRVPATTANLGPGFDSFGCALARYNTFTFTAQQQGLCFENVLPQYANEDNLAVVAYRHAMQALQLPMGGLKLRLDADIPVCSGLGSSATLIVAGVTAAYLLNGRPIDKAELLRLATEIEGHPDNVAPAIYGGLTVSITDDNGPHSVPFPVHPSVRFVVLSPDFSLSTHQSRSVLPKSVSMADAVFNLSHAAVLTRALALGDATLIEQALQDRLHQPYRAALVDGFDVLRDMAKRAGCCGFCLSGAGPTCLALTCDEAAATRLQSAVATTTEHWAVWPLEVDQAGLSYEIL